jgi:hypothetical protein
MCHRLFSCQLTTLCAEVKRRTASYGSFVLPQLTHLVNHIWRTLSLGKGNRSAWSSPGRFFSLTGIASLHRVFQLGKTTRRRDSYSSGGDPPMGFLEDMLLYAFTKTPTDFTPHGASNS